MNKLNKPIAYNFIIEKKSVLEYSKESEAYYAQELQKKDAEIEKLKEELNQKQMFRIDNNGNISIINCVNCERLKEENDKLGLLLKAKEMENVILCNDIKVNLQEENERLRKHIEKVGDVDNLKPIVQEAFDVNRMIHFLEKGFPCTAKEYNRGYVECVIRLSQHIKGGVDG